MYELNQSVNQQVSGTTKPTDFRYNFTYNKDSKGVISNLSVFVIKEKAGSDAESLGSAGESGGYRTFTLSTSTSEDDLKIIVVEVNALLDQIKA